MHQSERLALLRFLFFKRQHVIGTTFFFVSFLDCYCCSSFQSNFFYYFYSSGAIKFCLID